MEIKNIDEAITKVLEDGSIREYFDAEQIKKMGEEMQKVIYNLDLCMYF